MSDAWRWRKLYRILELDKHVTIRLCDNGNCELQAGGESFTGKDLNECIDSMLRNREVE